MRKSAFLLLLVSSVVIFDLLIVTSLHFCDTAHEHDRELMRLIVKELGCSDLAVATEARYTRHPAASDGVVPFMDHPGDIEHFPTGSFWQPLK